MISMCFAALSIIKFWKQKALGMAGLSIARVFQWIAVKRYLGRFRAAA